MKAISLDAAGTLFDLSEPVGEVYTRFAHQEGFALLPAEVEKRFRAAFKASPAPSYDGDSDGHTAERSWWRALVLQATEIPPSEAFERLFHQLFAHYEKPSAWQLYPDTLPFLEKASAKYRLAVVSNFDDRLHPILDGLGLSPFFEIAISSSLAQSQKPDSRIFERLLKELALPPEEVLHIGDSLKADYEGALQVGMKAFHLQRAKGQLLAHAAPTLS
ncbi:MAG: HAD-IA family hydrolase [Roseibacillus sp.]